MTDQLAALVRPASRLETVHLPTHEAFDGLVGLRPGTTLQVGGTSVALALAAKATEHSWAALVGLPHVNLRAAAELGVDLNHLVVIPQQTVDVFAAVIDAFDIVIASPPPQRKARQIAARVRERDACLIVLGPTPESDLTVIGSNPRWHGIGDGHGHLQARTIDVTVTGRRNAARPRHRTIWLPDEDGRIRRAAQIARLHA
jgi:hypothetical protein